MNTVEIEAPALTKLLAAGGPVMVTDEAGLVVGVFAPYPAPQAPGLRPPPGLLPRGTIVIPEDDDFTDFEGATR